MSDCPKIEQCPFFTNKLSNMPATSENIKNSYCRNNFEKCARYRISTKIGAEFIPENLFPHQKDVADKLINENKLQT